MVAKKELNACLVRMVFFLHLISLFLSLSLLGAYLECVWPDGRLYKGDFHENAAHGYGIEYNPDGTIRHDGLWDHDAPV